jgi:hypothetical protein
MDATLMLLLIGDTRACGTRLDAVEVGEGVLSIGDEWKPKPEPVGLGTPIPDAAEVSGRVQSAN